MSGFKTPSSEFYFEQRVNSTRQSVGSAPQRVGNESLSNLSLRFARKDSKNSSNDISIQSSKRSYVDLTGEDEIIEIPKNSHIDNSKARHKIVDGSTSSSIDIIDSRAHPKVVGRSKDSHDTVNSKNHLKIDDHSTKRRVDAVATNKLLHGPSRVADEPNHKRVKLIVGHRESESDDELPFSAKSEVKEASKLLQKFQLPRGHETPTLANAAKVVVPIPSFERRQFLRNLEQLRGPPVSVVNEIDQTSPSLSFTFVNESVIGDGVQKADEEFMSGCSCREENGRNCGCEYRSCHCLQQSDRDEKGAVHFPYAASQRNRGCLRQVYLNSRNHIYECNRMCNCRANCKNKLVQNGRQVPLEIFKTTNRGWGIRCPEALKKGQFVDTYRGEIITNDEANERSLSRTVDQENYLMDLDKFNRNRMISKAELKEEVSREEYKKIKAKVKSKEYEVSINKEDGTKLWLNPNYEPPYVCDGMEVGGPTRFMNHSCEPNCRIFTVSYNHADTRIYELAFFAVEEIAPGTELTFDYKDEDDRDIITDKMADEVEREKGYRPARCLCGSNSCRRYFFN